MVIHSIEDETGIHCVDVIGDANGRFTFKVFRRDPEDQGRWTLVADYSKTAHASEADAFDAASGKIPWVKDRLQQDVISRPSMSTPAIEVAAAAIGAAEWQVRVDLAACYRLCALKNWDDLIYTHISATVPGEAGRFLINPFGLRFDEITASNLVKIDVHGNIIGDQASRVNLSGFAIHGAVHGARGDAMCVMHLHNENGVAVGMQQGGLLPLSQHALRFYRQIAYHDYEGLALSPHEQVRLIEHLGDFPALLLRNHGTLISGRTIAEAYVLMDTLDKACAFQLKAQSGGGPLNMPSPEVCAKTCKELLGDGAPEGTLEWPALLRMLDVRSPSYRN